MRVIVLSPDARGQRRPGAGGSVERTRPGGEYQLDPAHARLLFRVNHPGFSHYTALIQGFDARLSFDPDRPEAMTVSATADPASVETHYPDATFDFNGFIEGPDFLDAAAYPEARFVSTDVRRTAKRRPMSRAT